MKNKTFYQQKLETENKIKLKELEMKHFIQNSAKNIALAAPLFFVFRKKIVDKPKNDQSKFLNASFLIELINKGTLLYNIYRQILKRRVK